MKYFIVPTFIFRRALSSSSIDGVCAMLNHACSILEQDFQEVLYVRLRQGMPSGFDFSQAYNLVQSSLQFGKLQSSDDETQKQKTAFLVGSSITLHSAFHIPFMSGCFMYCICQMSSEFSIPHSVYVWLFHVVYLVELT